MCKAPTLVTHLDELSTETVSSLEMRYPSNIQPPQALRKQMAREDTLMEKKNLQMFTLVVPLVFVFFPSGIDFPLSYFYYHGT